MYILTDQRTKKPVFIARNRKEVEARKKGLSGNHYVIEAIDSAELDQRMGMQKGQSTIRAFI